MDVNPWKAIEEQAGKMSTFDERQEKIDKISYDPKPEYAEPVKKPYPTTELHYVICVDEELANESMPEAKLYYDMPHKLGALLVSGSLSISL